MRATKNAPDIGELESGELYFDKMFGFLVAEEGIGGGVIASNAVKRFKRGSEAMIRLDDEFWRARLARAGVSSSPFVGAENGEFFSSMFNYGEISLAVGDEKVFWNSTRDSFESIESLAGGATVFGNIAFEMRG